MALIVTLGILAVVTLAVMAYLVSLRIERLAARNHLDRQICREYVRVGLIQAMESIQASNASVSVSALLQQRVYPVEGWAPGTNAILYSDYFRGECMGSIADTNTPDYLYLFNGAVTNLVPRRLHGDARLVRSGWPIYITGTNQNLIIGGGTWAPLDAALDGVTNGRIAFLIVNCSGFAPPQSLADDLNPAPRFMTQLDIPTNAADDVFHVAYDHNPYQRYEFFDRLGSLDAGITNRFDINSWTNSAPLTLWLTNSALELAACGYAGTTADDISQNLLDFMDADRVPLVTYQTGTTDRTDPSLTNVRPSRVEYGLEDLPMLNEVAVTETNDILGLSSSVSIELWHPFLPALSPKHMMLWVGVFTNEPPASTTFAMDEWPGPFGFTNELPQLRFPERQYHVVQSPPSRRVRFTEGTNTVPISGAHPIWIWPKLFVLDTNINHYVCVDEALLTAVVDGVPRLWTAPGSVQVRDPRRNLLATSDPFDQSDWLLQSTLWTSNINCTVVDAPFVHPNAPMSAIGEIGYVYAAGTNGTVDFTTLEGAATLDRFAVFPPVTNVAARNRIQANSGFTNVVRRLFENVIAYTNDLPAFTLQPDELAIAYETALTNTLGQGWTCFSNMLPDVARAFRVAGLDGGSSRLNEDLLRALPERVTFRQNVLVVIIAAQRLAPAGKVIADQRAAMVVIRDAYTGGWFVHDWYWLND
jgi:hypothetical protein